MRLVVSNDFRGVERLAGAVREFARDHELPARAAYALELVTEEIATNIAKYAHDDRGERGIGVELEVVESAVVLRFEDDGKPFNPAEAPPADLAEPLETRRVGGLGIHLVRRYADSIRYSREDDRNRIEIRIPAANSDPTRS